MYYEKRGKGKCALKVGLRREWAAAQSGSIENRGCMSVATGGPAWSRLMRLRLQTLIIDLGEFSGSQAGSGGWDKEKSYEETTRLEKRTDRWQHERRQ